MRPTGPRNAAHAEASTGGAQLALHRLAPYVVFGALPAAVVVGMFAVAISTGPLALDFRGELYPTAKAVVEGENPYPQSIWPPLATSVAVPFTPLPSEAAGVAVALLGLGCMAGAILIVGVRDWRVFGVVALWPPVLTDVRIAHLTPLLCLLAALIWRFRDRPWIAGLALGAAGGLKLFLWPLGVWLLATRRYRAAFVGGAAGVGSLLLIAPFASLWDYVDSVRDVGARFDQDSYSPFGLLTQFGAGSTVARAVTFGAGALLLAIAWRRKSFALTCAAALMLSPIVWLDYFALAAVPLAIARPTLSLAWFAPLLTWGLPSSGIATNAAGVARVLAIFGGVLLIASFERTTHRSTPVQLALER